jgi:EmrB/QacA subfamily drug resistance transporter
MPPPQAAAAFSAPSPAPKAQAAPSPPQVFSHQQILQVITGILLCILLAALDQTVVVPAVPAIAAELHAFGHLSWIVSAYLLTSTAATPIYGKLSDMYGRRALLLPAIALFIAASALCALSQNLVQLIAFRALQGLGGGGLMAMAQAAIADVVSPRERGRYQGYMAGTWGVASVAGPVVGGWFTDHLSWTFVFWINVPFGLAAMVLCNRALKLLPVRGLRGKIDYTGAALLTGGVTALLLVLSWGGSEYRWDSPEIIALIVLCVVLFAGLVAVERRASEAILPPRMFRENVFTRGVALAFISSIGLLGTTFLLPLLFQLTRGADASSSGFLVTPFLVLSTVGAFTGGQMSRRLGRTKGIVLVGFSLGALAFAAMAAMGPSTPLILLIVAMAVEGFGIGICLPNILVMVQNAAERRDVGTATGALLFLRSLGGAFGSTMVGALLTGVFTYRLTALGYPGHADLGALNPGGSLAAAAPAARAAGAAALSSGFSVAFGACCVLFVVGFVISLGLRDIPLRTVSGATPEDTPGTLGH